ncbi:hypothetical protein F7P10_19125 [Actinomadura sp. WMMB 499]|nr:hypothetical protein F7P10_19125 [Actinomadura sp. WMMB 499]
MASSPREQRAGAGVPGAAGKIRTDSKGGTHDFVDWVARRRLKYSIGFTLADDICDAILALPENVWQCTYDADWQSRPGAWWPS